MGIWLCEGEIRKTLIDQIEEEYREDFGIRIKVQSDRGRKDLQPVPLAVYEIESEQGRDKGIITLAEIVGEVDVERFHSDKHSQIRWIEEDEVDGFSEPAVEDFKHTLKIVFKRLREMDG